MWHREHPVSLIKSHWCLICDAFFSTLQKFGCTNIEFVSVNKATHSSHLNTHVARHIDQGCGVAAIFNCNLVTVIGSFLPTVWSIFFIFSTIFSEFLSPMVHSKENVIVIMILIFMLMWRLIHWDHNSLHFWNFGFFAKLWMYTTTYSWAQSYFEACSHLLKMMLSLTLTFNHFQFCPGWLCLPGQNHGLQCHCLLLLNRGSQFF